MIEHPIEIAGEDLIEVGIGGLVEVGIGGLVGVGIGSPVRDDRLLLEPLNVLANHAIPFHLDGALLPDSAI